MAAKPKSKNISQPRGDLDALRQRRDISAKDVESAAARVAKFFKRLAEDSTTPPPPPDPSEFDPLTEPHWELGMMFVFEMGGTVDHIRQVWSKYRRENYQPIDATKPTSNFRPQGPLKQIDLAVHTAIWTDEGAKLRPLGEAKRKIWWRAENQQIVGYGEPFAGGAPTGILHFHWSALTLGDDHTGLVLRFGDGSGYRYVRFANPWPDAKSRGQPSHMGGKPQNGAFPDQGPARNSQAPSGRKRGRKPKKLEAAIHEMKKIGRKTLDEMLEKELERDFGDVACRTTLRNARKAILDK